MPKIRSIRSMSITELAFGLLFTALLAILIIWFAYIISHPLGIGLALAAGILVVYLVAKRIRLYETTKSAEMELDRHIETALRKMVSIDGSYTDEDSANQELCLLLKELVPGADVHLVKPGSGDKGDIRVGNTIIEGKLDLEDKAELDRLVGQLQDYCDNSASPIRVVVYGKLRPDFRQRIEHLHAYYERILLHHREGIRTRKPVEERYVVVRHDTSGEDEDEETEY